MREVPACGFAVDGNDVQRGAVIRDGYKRTFDLCVLGIVGVLFAPLWLFLAIVIPLAIWLEDRGPIFFTQKRTGLDGQVFYMIKFRSMVPRAHDDPTPMASTAQPTKVGGLLRRFHLDELPQVLNILRGDMSLVGPRAEWLARHVLICKQFPQFAQRVRVKPGIAGLAQARGNYYSSPREKLRYDNLYIESLSPWLDLKLIFLCIKVVIQRVFSRQGQTDTASVRSAGDVMIEQTPNVGQSGRWSG